MKFELITIASLWVLIVLPSCCVGNYILHDFVPTTMRTQVPGKNTSGWNDLVAQFCPKFGEAGTRAVTIHDPFDINGIVGDTNQQYTFGESDAYKIQLSFDEGRVVTPWLQLKGRRAPPNPVVHIMLTRSGNALIDVHANVASMMTHDARVEKMLKDFQELEHWPKHVVVWYSWKTRHETDLDVGMLVLLSVGAAMTIVMGVRAMIEYRKHLQRFFRDMSADDDGKGVRASSNSVGGMMPSGSVTMASGSGYKPAGVYPARQPMRMASPMIEERTIGAPQFLGVGAKAD